MAISTAPSRGIVVPPPFDCAIAVPVSATPGTTGGYGSRIVSTAPCTTGVRAPQDGVKIAVPSPMGVLFRLSVRRLPRPCQKPNWATR